MDLRCFQIKYFLFFGASEKIQLYFLLIQAINYVLVFVGSGDSLH